LLCDQGDYAAAKKELAMVLDRDPSSNSARFNMARTLAAMGDHNGAIRDYESVLAKEPNDVAAHYQLGLSYAAVGRKSDAVTQIGGALQIDRDVTRAAEMRKKLEELQAH
jgi:thioredoxin-like negative regulator of GroEL